MVRTQKRKERAQRQRVPLGQAVRPNHKWSMDFVVQRLPDGRWIRVLTVVDQFTRECLTLFRRYGVEWREGSCGAQPSRRSTRRSAIDHRR